MFIAITPLLSTMCDSGKLQQAIQAAFERQYCVTGRGAFAHALGVQKDGFLNIIKKRKEKKKKKGEKGEEMHCALWEKKEMTI